MACHGLANILRLWHAGGMTNAHPLYGDLTTTSWDRVVDLPDGTRFPARVRCTVTSGESMAVDLAFRVMNDRPALVLFSAVALGPEPLSPTAVHDLPVAAIADDAVRRIAVMVAVDEARRAAEMTGASSYEVAEPWAIADRAAASRRRTPPLTDELLREVADIVNRGGREYIDEVRRLGASRRTASRWVAEARRRGLIQQGGDDA